MTLLESIQQFTITLQPLYDAREAAAIAKRYHAFLTGLDDWALPLHYDDALTEAQLTQCRRDLPLLQESRPLQYVTGEADFYGLSFKVTPEVLIPRPETEELVAMVVERANCWVRPSIWDVGTGSGCIAIAVAKALPNSEVYATDRSAGALRIANENAERHYVRIHYALHDMFDTTLPFPPGDFHIIVSNPPYIPASDKAIMHPNVVRHEPHAALFVPDNDMLCCYKALAKLAAQLLSDDGILMVETYHGFHKELAEVFAAQGLSNTQSLQDINGRDRFMIATR